jgi:glycosyltransferase involved in cell wall biosynthesis
MVARSLPPGRISIVVSTYKWPEALDVVLLALSEQTTSDFEVLVADDGSGPQTAAVVERWRGVFRDRLVRVWQPDEGFRKARILNLAAIEGRGDFFLFMDGDCIPRVGLVDAVRRAAVPGWFLSTKRVNLSRSTSRRVLEGQTPIWRWSAPAWMLRSRGAVRRPGFFLPLRDRRRPWRPDQPDFYPPDNGYGFFCGVAREAFVRANGWDARFVGWGCEDTDLAARLRRMGLRCGWAGPKTTMLHLWHPHRREETDPGFLANEEILRDTVASKRTEALIGLRELAPDGSGWPPSGAERRRL